MQITFTGHQVDVSDALKQFTKEKLERIHRHLDRIISISVTFSIEKLQHIAEANIQVPGKSLHASSESEESMYGAVDTLMDKLDRLVKKYKETEGCKSV